MSPLVWLPVVAATVSLLWLVPDWPWRHLDDPGHWGILGYLLLIVATIRRELAGRATRGALRRSGTVFLVLMPLVYLAYWTAADRTGGGATPGWLGIELAGALIYWLVAWASVARWAMLLPAGIAAHGLWDLAHHGRAAFVPDWYAAACLVVDVALGASLAMRLRGGRLP